MPRKTTVRKVEEHRPEIVSAVCRCFFEGLTAAQIRDKINETFPDLQVQLNREDPWRILSYAAKKKLLRFSPFLEYGLDFADARRVEDRFNLERVSIVRTYSLEDVAQAGAEMLLQRVRAQKKYPRHSNKNRSRAGEQSADVIHIGFGGGRAVRMVAQAFADLLADEPHDNLPRTLCIHALTGGFHVKDPTTDPNSFFACFVPNRSIPIKIESIGFPAPNLLEKDDYDRLLGNSVIKNVIDQGKKTTIIVTSVGNFEDEHCTLRCSREFLGKYMKGLKDAQCVADVLWHGIGANGLAEVDSPMRVMGVFKSLHELQSHIVGGCDSLLVVGPCLHCQKTKQEALQAVMQVDPPIFNHLVVDNRSVEPLLNEC